MKMKDQLDSAQPMKKHKAKAKKSATKKKKQHKADNKKAIKEKSTDTSIKVESIKATDAQVHSKADQKLPTLENTLKTQAGEDDHSVTSRQRASKTASPMSKEEQLIAINHIIKRLLLDEITQGEALRELRVGVLGIRQDAYTTLCGVSRKTLSEIENDKGNYTAEIINKVFKPFDLKVGLVPTSSQLLAAILTH
ncbi:helix-turn-helix transcriptional regulator [Marinomonas vulgaris]|nr:helix-turn-helix transcriptional regulator [Marinomonas vulgaris]